MAVLDGLNFGQLISDVGVVVGQVFVGTAVLTLVGLVFLCLFVYMYYTMKSKRVMVKVALQHSARLENIYQCTERTHADGSVWLYSVPWQKRVMMPKPPDECIVIDAKGKEFYEVYRISGDEYAYKEKRKLTKDEIRQLPKEAWVFERDEGLSNPEYKHVLSTFKKITPVQRNLVTNQLRKAEERKRKSWKDPQMIALMLQAGVWMVIFIALLVFWKDISDPALQSHGKALEMADKNIELAKVLGHGASVATADNSELLETSQKEQLRSIGGT